MAKPGASAPRTRSPGSTTVSKAECQSPPPSRQSSRHTRPWSSPSLELDCDSHRPAEDRFDDALLRVLSAHTKPQPSWLGFLDTGASDVVLNDAPRARAYHGWNYVLVQAGPHEARTWRSDEGRWFTALPELPWSSPSLELDRDSHRPAEDRFDDALLRVLSAHTKPQPSWLGFLDTGASDVVLNDDPRARAYHGWNYVLVQAGPHE